MAHAVRFLLRDEGVQGDHGRVGQEGRRARGVRLDLAAGARAQHAHSDFRDVQNVKAAVLEDLNIKGRTTDGRKDSSVGYILLEYTYYYGREKFFFAYVYTIVGSHTVPTIFQSDPYYYFYIFGIRQYA